MSLLALNKYDWQNFIQQGITRKVKKYRGDTHISAPGQWYVYPFLRAPLYSTFACCLIPVLTLVVSLVMLDDIDDISFSKRRYFLIVSWMSISVYCIPTRDTHITRDMCMGIHISRGYTYHCDTVIEYFLPWYHFTTVMEIFLPWDHFTTVIKHSLHWYHFTTVCSIFYLDIILLLWCNIFYLDIIVLPWCDIFYLDMILLQKYIWNKFL